MKGKEILESVREILDDSTFSRYAEINRAYREICAVTNYRWLEQSSTGLTFFQDSTSTYTLRATDILRITSIYARATALGTGIWIAPVLSRLDFVTEEPTNPSTNARYINTTTGTSNVTTTAVTLDYIYTWSGSVWTGVAPVTNYTTLVETEELHYNYDGSAWNVVATDYTNWTELTWVSHRDMETLIGRTSTGDRVPRTNPPTSYTLTGDHIWTMRVSPIPDNTYDVRVDYIQRPAEISEETRPEIPIGYMDLLVYKVASSVLMKRKELELGTIYERKAAKLLQGLIIHSFGNHNAVVDKPQRPLPQ